MTPPSRRGELPRRRAAILGGGRRYSSGSDGGLGVGDGLGLGSGLGLGLIFSTPRTKLTLSPLSWPFFFASPSCVSCTFFNSLAGMGGGG